MKNLVCITAAEWRNICSTGRIRIQESRSVPISDELCPEDHQALFALAPDRFLLGETSDFLIVEYLSLKSEIDGVRPPGYEVGVRWLLLEDVLRFFPIRTDDAWAFETDANKAQVKLGEASLERQWEDWFKVQLAHQALLNGLTLVRTMGLLDSPTSETSVGTDWCALAEHLSMGDSAEQESMSFPSCFLASRGRLFDLVREDSDSGAILVSCPIEWINIRSSISIFEADPELAKVAQNLHQKYSNLPFDSSLVGTDDLIEFADHLCVKLPDAFPDAWHPALMALYIRYDHRIRFGSPTPDELVAAVRALDVAGDRRSGQLLAFLLGATLGPNKTHSLERWLHHGRFAVALALPPQSGQSPQDIGGSVVRPQGTGSEQVQIGEALMPPEQKPSANNPVGAENVSLHLAVSTELRREPRSPQSPQG